MNARRDIAIVLVCAILVFLFFRAGGQRRYSALDFGIFYCAGLAVDRGENPYALEPLRTCEHQVWPREYLGAYAEPAALPGYALIPFAALAKLSYARAEALWLILSCLAFGIAVAAGARLSKLPAFAIFALLFVPVAALSITVGQLGPLIVAPLFSAACLLRRGRDAAAAAAVLVSAIEPHVALPAAAALFVLVPRSRAVISAGGAILLAAHFLVLHTAVGIAYFTQVLPAMSRAEASAADQYGTFWLLHAAGLPAALSGIGADLLYAAGIAGGILLARRAGKTPVPDRAMLIALPVALSLLVAPYLHDVQLCASLAAPLAALGTNPGDRRWISAAVLLAIPWYGSLHSALLAFKSVLGAATFAALADRRRVVGAIAVVTAAAALFVVLRHLPIAMPHADVIRAGKTTLAAQSWGAYLSANPVLEASGPAIFAPKLLAWLSLGAITLLGAHRRGSGEAE